MNFEMPEDEAGIPAAIARLAAEAKRIRAQLKATEGLIVAVQSMCSHPSGKQSHSQDYDGGTSSRCRVCDKSW